MATKKRKSPKKSKTTKRGKAKSAEFKKRKNASAKKRNAAKPKKEKVAASTTIATSSPTEEISGLHAVQDQTHADDAFDEMADDEQNDLDGFEGEEEFE